MPTRRLLRVAAASALAVAVLAGLGRPLPALAQASQVARPTPTAPAAQTAPTAQVQWTQVERVVAFGDVHGAYTELTALLRETGVIDAQQRWVAGTTHVVSLGDLLDRGADSRKVMDLLMRLQGEARAAGGQLHVVLGNHEAMNLLGDLRYVDVGEYAAYADEESASERAEQRKAWEAAPGAASRPAFDQKFPPGYFAHRAALSATGKYGQWLLSQPVAIAINDTLFMHAGPSAALRGMSLQELNLRYRTALTNYLGLADRLARARLLQAGDDFNLRVRLARERLAVLTAAASADGVAVDASLGGVVAGFAVADDAALLASDGPNWYRGAAVCKEVAEADVLLPVLQQFGLARLVIGHTPTRDGRAVTRFDGRVVRLDTGMNRAVYGGRAAALLLQAAGASLQYAGESQARPLQPERLFVAPKEIDDASVLAALSVGEVTVTAARGPNELSVSVEHAGRRTPAVFQVRNAGAARKEVAAYRLDRQLGLGIVPVTVEREVQGQRGVLQSRPHKWLTQTDVQSQKLPRRDWCEAEPQYQLVYAFDTLIANERRTPDSLLFDADAWFVYVTSHDRAFGAGHALPGYLRQRPPSAGPELRRRAAALNEDNLATSLGDLIDDKGRKAILERRDVLLALPGGAAAGALSR